jgi:hypothetical protein
MRLRVGLSTDVDEKDQELQNILTAIVTGEIHPMVNTVELIEYDTCLVPPATGALWSNRSQNANFTLLQDKLQRLRDSCLEGLDQNWDCTTDEGREPFEWMADDVEFLAKTFGIPLKEYRPI